MARRITMLKQLQVSAFTTILLIWGAVASAQTAPSTPGTPGGSATNTETAAGGDLNWLWIVIALAVVAAIVWYFMRGRRTTI
jgi:hypothetical protein